MWLKNKATAARIKGAKGGQDLLNCQPSKSLPATKL